MIFNEDSRVKIPALLHFTRLGYRYLSLKGAAWDESSNIFPTVFKDSLQKINPAATPDDIERTLQEVSLLLNNEDLGKAFYERLLSATGVKLIDFENFDDNSFHVVTELPCINDDEEFRPDITLLINGLPLIFIEVKKPNNRDGILAERNRIASRFRNSKFRRFVNITQLMMFSTTLEKLVLGARPFWGPKLAPIRTSIFPYPVPNLPRWLLPIMYAGENRKVPQGASSFSSSSLEITCPVDFVVDGEFFAGPVNEPLRLETGPVFAYLCS